MLNLKPRQLKIRWNKDMSISVYCGGKVVHKYSGPYAYKSVWDFIDGWFGDHPKNTKWIYAR